MGAHSVWLYYGQNHGKARQDTNARAVSARYDYALCRRTRLYAGYTMIDNDPQASFTVNNASNAGPTATTGKRVRQAVMGITHQF
jgi:predicted porin